MTYVRSLRIGLRIGEGIGLSQGSGSTYTTDATSGKATPSSAAEWTAFLSSISSALSAPQHLWLMQEPSVAAADSIGSKTLTVSNVLFGKPIAGWARMAIGGPEALIASSLSNASMVSTGTSSFMVLVYARFDPSPAVLRAMITYGTPVVQTPALTNKVRLREGGSLVDSSGAHNATVHPFLFAFNVTASTVRLYTDLEKLSVTYSTSTGSSLTLTTSLVSDITATDFLYGAAWDGVAGEINDAEAKKLITGLGYSPPWT
jgi:hypothetical protein